MIKALLSFELHSLFKSSFANHWWILIVLETRSSESWIHTCQCLSADWLHEACLASLSHKFYVSSNFTVNKNVIQINLTEFMQIVE